MKESLLVHLWLLCTRPLLLGVAMSALWYYVILPNGFHAGPNEESVRDNFQFLTVFHSLFASFILAKVWADYDKLQRFVMDNNEEGFRKERFHSIPLAFKLLLVVLSVLIQGASLYRYYDEMVPALVGTFSTAFVLMLFWEVANNLDDPVKGVWYKKRKIPASWLTPQC